MPLPLFLIAVPIAVSALYGTKKGYDAYSDNTEAARLGEEAQSTYDRAKQSLESSRERCTKDLAALGRLKLEVWQRQLGRFVSLFEQIRNVEITGTSDVGVLAEAGVSRAELTEMKRLSSYAAEALTGGGTALGAGALAGVASYGGAMMFATASTGTAIGSLTGVAATNATLAWFGGGSLAAGGFGMAGGMAVLGGIVAAPVLAVGGFVLASKAAANLAKAQSNLAKARAAATEMRAASTVVKGIRKVAGHFTEIITALDERTTPVLDDLERVISANGRNYASYSESDRRKVHRAVLFAQAIKAVLEMPILTPSGGLAKGHGKALKDVRALLGETAT